MAHARRASIRRIASPAPLRPHGMPPPFNQMNGRNPWAAFPCPGAWIVGFSILGMRQRNRRDERLGVRSLFLFPSFFLQAPRAIGGRGEEGAFTSSTERRLSRSPCPHHQIDKLEDLATLEPSHRIASRWAVARARALLSLSLLPCLFGVRSFFPLPVLQLQFPGVWFLGPWYRRRTADGIFHRHNSPFFFLVVSSLRPLHHRSLFSLWPLR